MKRTGATITVTVIAPGVAVSLLGLLYIFLPKGGGERIPFLATIILTEIMFLVMLTQFVPLSRDIPTVEVLFLSLSIILCFISVPITILEWLVKKKQEKDEANGKDGTEEKGEKEKDNLHSTRNKIEPVPVP